jgi:TetR/AcrR family transcriptional repressor of nem operon
MSPPVSRRVPRSRSADRSNAAATSVASSADARGTARERLLQAALRVVRQKGFAATTVDDLCAAAGVTKGAFFHHFRSKEDLGVAAAQYWAQTTGALFAQAPYHAPADPLDRVFAYLDFRAELIRGTTAEFTCLVGTMAQETFETAPAIRDACYASISGHAATLEADIGAAIEKYAAPAGVTAASLALHTQAVLQGAFILAKAKDDPAIALDSVAHLRRYVALLFGRAPASAAA